MDAKTIFEWHGAVDSTEGIATFHLLSGKVSVHLRSFLDARRLDDAIQATLKETRFEARVGLLNEIARIKP